MERNEYKDRSSKALDQLNEISETNSNRRDLANSQLRQTLRRNDDNTYLFEYKKGEAATELKTFRTKRQTYSRKLVNLSFSAVSQMIENFIEIGSTTGQ